MTWHLYTITKLHIIAAVQLSFPEVLIEIIGHTEQKLETQLFAFFERIKIELFFKQVYVHMHVYICIACAHASIYVCIFLYVDKSCLSSLDPNNENVMNQSVAD